MCASLFAHASVSVCSSTLVLFLFWSHLLFHFPPSFSSSQAVSLILLFLYFFFFIFLFFFYYLFSTPFTLVNRHFPVHLLPISISFIFSSYPFLQSCRKFNSFTSSLSSFFFPCFSFSLFFHSVECSSSSQS